MANYEPCSICEEYIEGVICDKDKCPVGKMKSENEDLFYKLSGVMHYVDKWLDGDELKQDEVNRAMLMREKTLQMVENLEIELKAMRGAANSYKSEIERLQERYDRTMDNLKAVLDERADHTEAIKEYSKYLVDKSIKGFLRADDIVDCCYDFTHQPTKIEHNSLCETETYESR